MNAHEPRPQSLEPQQGLSDGEVVERVVAGEPALFEILMRRYNQRVYRAVRAVIRNDAEVEDVMQQAYLSAFAHLGQFRGDAKFSTWLVRIAVNEACARLRPHGPKLVAIDGDYVEMDPTTKTPEDLSADKELRHLLENSLDHLAEAYRTVFVLREIEGLDTREVADALSISEDLVKTRLHRAKALLRSALFDTAQNTKNNLFPFHAARCDRVVAAVFALLPQMTK